MALNPAQAEAVSYVQGPCLVLAGAGSGKTRVITAKIVKLYRDYMVQPQRICALTFTNKAAAEMRERVARELGKDVAARIWISTAILPPRSSMPSGAMPITSSICCAVRRRSSGRGFAAWPRPCCAT